MMTTNQFVQTTPVTVSNGQFTKGNATMRSVAAPGKIILTGDHAVVYGRPALVMAVNRYATCSIHEVADSKSICIVNHNGKSSRISFDQDELNSFYSCLTDRHRRFLDKLLPVNRILDDPLEIIPFAISELVAIKGLNIRHAIQLQLDVTIPVGCGMGSSAAVALSILKAAALFFNTALTDDELYDYALASECLRHGNASGVDPFISLHGGFARFQKGSAIRLPMPQFRFYLALTGVPASGTGECVVSVRDQFAGDSIWDEFASVAADIEQRIESGQHDRMLDAIRHNHRLLTQIGVVPQRVQQFIKKIEVDGGAAKISGAGSIRGDNAGVVIIFSDRDPSAICHQFGCPMLPIQGDVNGLRIV